MSIKKTKKEQEKPVNANEHLMKLYAAAAEIARTNTVGQIQITNDDLERVSNDSEIQDLLDARSINPDGTNFGAKIRKGRLESSKKKGTHTPEQWIALLDEFDYRCQRCGCQFSTGLTKDHIIPISKGGSNSIENLQPLCLQCNSSDGGAINKRNWIEWRRNNGFGLGSGCFCWINSKGSIKI